MKLQYTEEELSPLLNQLMDEQETDEVEFKSAKEGFPGAFWETYSSFANTHGGVIILGVREKSGKFIMDGLIKEQVVKYRKDFFDTMHNPNKVNRTILKDGDVREVEFNGMYMLYFCIPQAPMSARPVYCGTDPYRGTYRRDWEGDYLCTPEEVSSMFADANLSQSRDARIMENYGMDDLDMNSVEQYRILFDRTNPDHVWSALGPEEFLTKLNVLRTDRKTGGRGVTMAGLLMFGTYSALTEALPNFFPDYQEKQSDGDRWIDRICPDGNWESNLFQFYRRVLPILQGFLPKPFKLDDNLRQGETSANVAVREAFTNALVHADYLENASISVHKYPKYMEFSNPGTLLISIRQYYESGGSVCRNKLLQTMFTFLGSAEKAGSGTDKIIRGWDEQNWKRPFICEKSRPNKVVLIMAMESLMDDSVLRQLRQEHGDIVDKLSHAELTALTLVHAEEQVNNDRLRSALGMHRTDVTTLLVTMTEKGLLEPHGYGRGRTYTAAIPSTNMPTSDSNVATSDSNVATSDSNVATSGSNVATSIPMRYTRNQLRARLIEICSEWRTKEYIAQALGREIQYVRVHVLPDNLDILERLYEDIPNHPAQKYRARETGKQSF